MMFKASAFPIARKIGIIYRWDEGAAWHFPGMTASHSNIMCVYFW
jgi:hypothetical protein